MRILHLTSEYPPQKVFGLGRFVRDLAEEQVHQGHQVTVITNSMGGEQHESLVHGVRILRVDHPPPPKPLLTTGCVMVFNILLLRRALELGSRKLAQFDVVCSHDWLTAPAAQAIQESFGPTHICTFHDTIVGKRLGKLESAVDHFTAEAEAWAAKTATHVIANSTATQMELTDKYGADPDRISVVPCAITPESFPVTNDPVRLSAFRETFAADEELLVLYVGRLDLEKGVDVLLGAFAEASLSLAKLCIVGTGAMLEELRLIAERLGISDRTNFLGYVENPALAHLYQCADMLVCPSLYEPFGMVALEGMLQGTPAIVSDTGGLAELVDHGITGLMVPPGDSTALAECLRQLAKNSAMRERMGAAAKQSVLEHRIWSIACQRTTKVYQAHQTLNKKPSTPSSKHLFVASNLNAGGGYSAGRVSRQLLNRTRSDDNEVATLTTSNVETFPLRAINRQEVMILDAFHMAAKLLRFGSRPPQYITCSHWDGILASSVLRHVKDKPKLCYFCPPISEASQTSDEADTFEHDILLWATEEADEVFVPDPATLNVLEDHGIRADVTPFPEPDLCSPRVGDTDLFRASFAEPSEHLAIVALRLEPPFWGEAFLRVADAAAKSALPIRWVVCGDGKLLSSLQDAATKRRLPINFTGCLPDGILSAMYRVADVAVIPFEKATYTSFVREALACSLPILVGVGMGAIMGEHSSLLYEVDFTKPGDAVQQLARVLALPGHKEISAPRSETSSISVAPETSRGRQNPNELVLYNDWGIGDELLLSAVAREIKRQYPKKRVWIRSRFGFHFPEFCESDAPPASVRRVQTIYQNQVLYGPSHHAPFPGHLVQQMLDKVALDTGIRVTAENYRPEVRLANAHGNRQMDLVILHSKPNPRLPSKDWGLNRWQRLCDLLHDRGLRIIQLGAVDEPQLPHAEDQRGLPVAEIPDLISTAGVVICLVGFFMHAAAATETPTVVIYGGREHPAIDGYPGHIHLRSDPLECRGRWGCHLAPDTECPHDMRCMENLTPELVDEMIALSIAASEERVEQ